MASRLPITRVAHACDTGDSKVSRWFTVPEDKVIIFSIRNILGLDNHSCPVSRPVTIFGQIYPVFTKHEIKGYITEMTWNFTTSSNHLDLVRWAKFKKKISNKIKVRE